jgi:hypothetical protein
MLHGALAKEAAYEQEWELPEEKVESNLRLLREARGSVGVVDDALEDRTNMLYETERVFYYFGRPFRYARALNRRPRLVRGHDRAVAEMDSVLSRASLATSEDEESLKGLEAALWSAPGGRVGRLLGQRSNSEPLGIVAGMSAEEYSVLEAVEILRGMGWAQHRAAHGEGAGAVPGKLLEVQVVPSLPASRNPYTVHASWVLRGICRSGEPGAHDSGHGRLGGAGLSRKRAFRPGELQGVQGKGGQAGQVHHRLPRPHVTHGSLAPDRSET